MSAAASSPAGEKPDFRSALESQPQNLAAGAELVREALAGSDLAPLRSGSIVFSGIGASWHALLPAVRALRMAGRRAFAVPAPELAQARDAADAYVLVSQSGASTEVLAALEAIGERAHARTFAVSARADGALARASGAWLPLGPLPDSAVSTLSYTATLQTLGMLCAELLAEDGRGARAASAEGWERLPELAQQTIERHDGRAASVAERQLVPARALDAVGAAPSTGSAGETALLGREALHLPASGEETRQYLHGPLEAAREGFACVLLGAERELQLARSLASYGASVCIVSALAAADGGEDENVASFTIPAVSELAAPVLEILPVQLAVAHAAALRGLTVSELARAQQDTKIASA